MSDYKKIWLALVQIEAHEDSSFKDLVDFEGSETQEYIGGWCNLLIKANDIHDALEIIPRGLDERMFKVIFIDNIGNVNSLVDDNELDTEMVEEIDWLLSTDYVFMISGKIFPYFAE